MENTDASTAVTHWSPSSKTGPSITVYTLAEKGKIK